MRPASPSQVWPAELLEPAYSGSPSKDPHRLLSAKGSRRHLRLQRSPSTVAHQQKFFLQGGQAAWELTKWGAPTRLPCRSGLQAAEPGCCGRLYTHIHLPVAIVAGWMCAYYAVLSFLIARRLCKEAVLSTPARPPAPAHLAAGASGVGRACNMRGPAGHHAGLCRVRVRP